MINLLRKRKSVRQFTGQKIDAEKIEILKEALLRSPTSRGRQSWEFIVIQEREALKMLSRAKESGSEFIADAAIAVIVCGDSTISDVWIEDCSIAATILQLTALSLGLGTCWSQIRNRDHDSMMSAESYLQDQLNIPDHIKIECIIGIGYPAEENVLVDTVHLNRTKIHTEKF
jgi:nitroreductase